MNSLRIVVFSLLVIGSAVILVSVFSFTPEKASIEDYRFGCTPDFWKNNLELWEVLGVDYNDDFDETFGKDYFEPDITLQEAINAEGVGINHIARSGTTAYLNAMADPEIDEESIRTAVHFGYIHQIDGYLESCKEIEKIIP